MLDRISTIEQLNDVIAHATAPAFLLGAVAGYLSLLMSRLQRIADRARATPTAGGPEPIDGTKALAERARMLNRAVYLSVLSALSTAAMLILAFVCAVLGIEHRMGVAFMFIVALALLMGSLVMLTREVRLTMKSMHLD